MRKTWFLVLAGVSTLAPVLLAYTPPPRVAIAQTTQSTELYYLYFGQKVPLKLRQDVIVAEGKAPTQLSGSEPYYRSLRRHLRGGGTLSGDDGSNPPGVQIDPIGNQYALVGFASTSPAQRSQIQKAIQADPNLKATLPVLTRSDRPSDVIVLPNRIIVSFKPGVSAASIQETLKSQNLEIISKEPFTDSLYVVRSSVASGTAVLNTANQLSQVPGVDYATPDFIQVPATVPSSLLNKTLDSKRSNKLLDILEKLPSDQYSPTSPALLPLLWNLDSTPLHQCLKQPAETWECLFKKPATKQLPTAKRADIRAREAWKISETKGRGVVVAVVDSLIQSDHPDLAPNLHRVTNSQCPKETSGWDFTNEINQGSGCLLGDPEASIDAQEIEDLKEKLRDSELLTNSQLVQKYPKVAEAFQNSCQPQCSSDEIAGKIRRALLGYTERAFHGTNVAGVIAANSTKGTGLLGVAPNAKILPIRVLGLGGSGQDSAIAKAIRYAAARKADIINLSLGPEQPIVSQPITSAIAEILAKNPKLVIVASAGNHAKRFPGVVMSPACIPGVVSVGATNLAGKRAPYSNFGSTCGAALSHLLPNQDKDDSLLSIVAPGGQLDLPDAIDEYPIGGVFTTGGTFVPGLWRGWKAPDRPFQNALKTGVYIWTDGTSFSAPAVAGVLALMKAEDPQRQLTRQQLVKILKQTASYNNLDVSPDMKQYQAQKQKGTVPNGVSPEQYFFGSGLVNAEAAVREVKRQVGK
ncbi:MAG: S8 family serine peptidase [Cyanobacteria bacterium RU_5_0]|nr:S8 family serine peptidase [Cyanobacteria bacterium RU_5_0]